MTDPESRTLVVEREGQRVLEVPRFMVCVVQGPDQGKKAASIDGRLMIGSAPGLALELSDPTVSRYHAELEATPRGIAVRDLGSTNGTMVGKLRLGEVLLTGITQLRVGRTLLEVELSRERSTVVALASHRFGGLWGASVAMRTVYSLLTRAAPTSVPVLITGETGTGKELAARALHDASERRSEAFEVVDCGGLPPTLMESELFGHTRGSFTGAVSEHAGAFERADRGTLFLDEIGELPLDAQPKLLRALSEGQVRRIGAQDLKVVDVRVVAATNRDLRREVNAGRFRADLYYRLAVIDVRMPALRERLDDLPMLARTLLDAIVEERGLGAHVEMNADTLEALARHDWPGNVRELRNYLEQLLILEVPPDLGASTMGASFEGFGELPWHAAKQRLLERFEHHYLSELLERTQGNVAEAARRAGVDRGTLFRSMRRLGIKR